MKGLKLIVFQNILDKTIVILLTDLVVIFDQVLLFFDLRGTLLGKLITLSQKKIYLASIARTIVMLERELASLPNQELQRIQKVKRIISEFNMLYKRVLLDEKV